MTERENFLERWSRKKAEAQRDAAEAPDSPAAPDASPRATDAAEPAAVETPARRAGAAPSSPAAPKPEFDLASLPSLDSITAATDIRAFLAPGVPQELTRAALRRAWTADPAIRDFVGLAENDWDFTNPAAVPGFGDIPPGTDIKKMIADIFGETNRTTEQAAKPDSVTAEPGGPQTTTIAAESPPAESGAEAASASETAGDTQPAQLAGATEAAAAEPQADLVHRNSNIASQQSIAETSPQQTARRRQHGGALPQS
jgi:hypothetical protein